MAEYKGRKVTLNKPRRIAKGEPSYGKKKTLVYVMDKGKVKKVTFGDPNISCAKAILSGRPTSHQYPEYETPYKRPFDAI